MEERGVEAKAKAACKPQNIAHKSLHVSIKCHAKREIAQMGEAKCQIGGGREGVGSRREMPSPPFSTGLLH